MKLPYCVRAQPCHGFSITLGVMALVGFAAKCGWEFFAGTSVFADNAGAVFAPVPLVHLIGGVVGGLMGSCAP
ncbi:hypothetical protein Ga0100231_007195 [Opitutaceae bacterium TAV4]|nr:hypothetical protein Ga0100231_007195 [Opitutaceae bacterium TAV4]RRK02737.1 hypothetical protein Ga0100230_006495 [Opitutaceae bacterium TAV3]